MNEATATEGSTAPAAPATPGSTPAPEDNSSGNSPPASPAPGLLADGGNKSGAEPPATETPSPDPGPGKIAERPEYIAEQFWDPATGTLKDEALANSYNDLRKEFNKLSQDKGNGAPENAEDYLVDYKPPHRSRPSGDQKEGDVLDRYGDLDAKDPVFVAMAKFAKDANMSPAQFTDGMQELMETLHPLLPKPYNEEKEKEILGEGAENMINTNRDWIDTLARNGVVNEDEFNLLLGFGSTALGVQLTNKLRLNSGEKPIPVNLNGGENKGRKSPDECAALMAVETTPGSGDLLKDADTPAGAAHRNAIDKAFATTYGTDSA